MPRPPLPFPSLVAASADDPLGAPERDAELARSRGSQLLELGAVGHLNPASGYGGWPRAGELIRMLESGSGSAPLAVSTGEHS